MPRLQHIFAIHFTGNYWAICAGTHPQARQFFPSQAVSAKNYATIVAHCHHLADCTHFGNAATQNKFRIIFVGNDNWFHIFNYNHLAFGFGQCGKENDY